MRSSRKRQAESSRAARKPALWADILAALWVLGVVGAYIAYGFPAKLAAFLAR